MLISNKCLHAYGSESLAVYFLKSLLQVRRGLFILPSVMEVVVDAKKPSSFVTPLNF